MVEYNVCQDQYSSVSFKISRCNWQPALLSIVANGAFVLWTFSRLFGVATQKKIDVLEVFSKEHRAESVVACSRPGTLLRTLSLSTYPSSVGCVGPAATVVISPTQPWAARWKCPPSCPSADIFHPSAAMTAWIIEVCFKLNLRLVNGASWATAGFGFSWRSFFLPAVMYLLWSLLKTSIVAVGKRTVLISCHFVEEGSSSVVSVRKETVFLMPICWREFLVCRACGETNYFSNATFFKKIPPLLWLWWNKLCLSNATLLKRVPRLLCLWGNKLCF